MGPELDRLEGLCVTLHTYFVKFYAAKSFDLASKRGQHFHQSTMRPSSGQHGTTAQSENAKACHSPGVRCVGALLCMVLVLVTSFVVLAHFHPNNSAANDHSCSLCALAHTGIAVNSIETPAPVFARSTLAEIPAGLTYSSLSFFSNYIRPPPQA